MVSRVVSPLPPPTNRKRLCSIPANILSVIIVIVATIIMAVAAVSIGTIFSLRGAREQAIQNARLSFTTCSDQVTSFFAVPMLTGESMQFLETPIPLPKPAFTATTWNESNWYEQWLDRSLMYHSFSQFRLHYISLIFADGSYIGCQQPLDNTTIVSCLFISQKGRNTSDVNSRATQLTRNYSKSNGALMGTAVTKHPYDPRTREFFSNPPRVRNYALWSSVYLTGIETTPVVSYFKPLFDPVTGEYVAVTSLDISLQEIDKTFKALLHGHPVEAFLIDNHHRLVASSLERAPFVEHRVPEDYVLTEEDVANNCLRSDKKNIFSHDNWVVCQLSIDSYGHQPLIDLHNKRKDLFPRRSCTRRPSPDEEVGGGTSDFRDLPANQSWTIVHWCPADEASSTKNTPSPSLTPTTTSPVVSPGWGLSGSDMFAMRSTDEPVLFIDLDGEAYYAMVSSLPALGAKTEFMWRLVVILREYTQTHHVLSGVNIAIGVTSAIVFILAALVGILIRFLLSPLSSVARKMASSSYLRTATDESSQDDGSDADRTPNINAGAKYAESPSVKPRDEVSKGSTMDELDPSLRVPSYLTEVAMIQMAYWGMADELRHLKAYVPEHIRMEILQKRKQAAAETAVGNGSAAMPSNGRGTVDLLGTGFNTVAEPSSKGNTSSSQGNSGGPAPTRRILKGPVHESEMTELPPHSSSSTKESGRGEVRNAKAAPNAKTSRQQHGSTSNSNGKFSHASSTAKRQQKELSTTVNTAAEKTSLLTKESLKAMQKKMPAVPLVWEGEGEGVIAASGGKMLTVTTAFEPIPSVGVGTDMGGGDRVEFNGSAAAQAREEDGCDNDTGLPDGAQVSGGANADGSPNSKRTPFHVPSVAGVSMEWQPAITGWGQNDPPPIFFGDNVLVDRDVSVAIVNIVQFHRYVLATHGPTITRDHEAMLRLIHSTARKCGGVLENFMGDHFWVSFNATTKCQHHSIAAACFALQISKTVNTAAILNATPTVAGSEEEGEFEMGNRKRNGSFASINTIAGNGAYADGIPPIGKHVFRAAPCGVTCGVATGRAFVGPMGNETIRRHTIISNAVPEAAALERQAIRYPNCGMLIGGDTIPAVEGYFMYMIMDATLLPGSGGKRRRIATVKGAMCAEGCKAEALRGISGLEAARRRRRNPYAHINASFNAFLEGRLQECTDALRKAEEQVMRFRGNIPEGYLLSPQREDADERLEASGIGEEARIDISMMGELVMGMITTQPPTDGRVYKSPMGEVYQPVHDRVLYAPTAAK